MLTPRALREHKFPISASHARVFMGVLSDGEGESVDIAELYLRFTFDAMCEIAFGMEKSSLTEKSSLAVALDSALALCTMRMVNPLWKIEKMFNFGVSACTQVYRFKGVCRLAVYWNACSVASRQTLLGCVYTGLLIYEPLVCTH